MANKCCVHRDRIKSGWNLRKANVMSFKRFSSHTYVTFPRTEGSGTRYKNVVRIDNRCSNLLGKSVPLQTWSGPEGSRKLRFPDYVTTAQDGGKVVSPTHWSPLPQEMLLVLISVRGWVDPRAIVRSEGFYVNEKSTDTSWNRTSDLLICSTAP